VIPLVINDKSTLNLESDRSKYTITMRSTTTLLQLCLLASVALSSPLPLVLVKDIEAVFGAAHPPAPVAAHRPLHALPEVIVFNSEEEDQTPIDNSLTTPSPTEEPAVVLAANRPVATEYLLSLVHHPSTNRKGGAPTKLVKLPADAVSAVESSSASVMEMGQGEDGVEVPGAGAGARIGMPCYHAKPGQSFNEFLAIGLVLVFIAVVVVAETLSRFVSPISVTTAYSSYTYKPNSMRRFFSRQGAIRLESDMVIEHQIPLPVKPESTNHFDEKQMA
jgi:hypothetical protein